MKLNAFAIVKAVYLVLYNFASAVGWSYIIWRVADCYLHSVSPAELWAEISWQILALQTCAVMEVLHPLIGLVRTPVLPVFIQVLSRLLVIWTCTAQFAESSSDWTLYLLLGSWAAVEPPRYLFYVANLTMKEVPWPLFQLRYSLFAVLYPPGIAGEAGQLYAAQAVVRTTNPVFWYIIWGVFIVVYPFGGPFMYYHMIKQRRRATRKRAEARLPPKPESGILFPFNKKGERSTQDAGKAVFAASIRALDAHAANRVESERKWRFNYARHIVRNVEMAVRSPRACLDVARAGLDYAHNHFDFVRDGKTMTLEEAMKTIQKPYFETGIVRGGHLSTPRQPAYEVPYKGKALRGSALIAQLQRWADLGTIEPSAAEAISAVAEHPEWLDLSDIHFVLLGAGSAMGPLVTLLGLGATVIAVDLDRPRVWKRLIGLTRESSGTLIFPLKEPQAACADDDALAEAAGANLVTQTPEIRNWLVRMSPHHRLCVGNYTYLDGAAHVQVSLGCDAIIKSLCESRDDVAVAFLCSPSDVFAIPDEARVAQKKNLARAPLWQRVISTLSRWLGAGLLVRNVRPVVRSGDGKTSYSLNDGVVVQQGPNYALAKRLQHWRAMLAREAGCLVSSNIAPSTRTLSVVHNPLFAAAYGGMHLFRPLDVFEEDTSNAVMAALLIHDLRNEESVGFPNPLSLFASGAFHSGVWRCAWKMGSVGVISALSFYLKKFLPPVVAGISIIAGLGGYVWWADVPLPHTW